MKLILLIGVLLGLIQSSQAQEKLGPVFKTLETLVDQYDHSFEKEAVKDKIVLFYITGISDPMTMVFDKLQNKKLVRGAMVQLIAGFGQAMGHLSSSSGLKYMQSGCKAKYGDNFFSVLIDMKGDVGSHLKTQGLTVVEISKIKNTVTVKDYGDDRKNFLIAMNTYFK